MQDANESQSLPRNSASSDPFERARWVRGEMADWEVVHQERAASEGFDPAKVGVPREGATAPDGQVKRRRWLPIFDPQAVRAAQLNVALEDKSSITSVMNAVLDPALDHQGLREVPAFSARLLSAELRRLGAEMPHFSPVIDTILADLGYVLTGSLKEFRFEPLLLVGAPGLGKTRFASRLAAVMGLPFEKISIGVTQSSGDLAGSSRFWSNCRPGRIARLLATSPVVCPVVLLDEVDKIHPGTQYPVGPVLLELLEPENAVKFRDECLELCFDASRLMVIATANDIHSIDAPLLSRMRIVKIKNPDPAERKSVIQSLLRDVLSGRKIVVDDAVVDRLVQINPDMRTLRRQLRHIIGHALIHGRGRIGEESFSLLEPNSARSSIGFIT